MKKGDNEWKERNYYEEDEEAQQIRKKIWS